MTSTLLVDQATQLRSLVRQTRQTRRRASVVAITSGKGGVGKSNVAVNLAITLSAAGKKVVLLDADLGLANADVLCGLDLPSNLSHVISRKKDLADVMVQGPGGFSLIGGASGLARMADLSATDRQRLVESLGELEEQADIILIDTGAGISPNVLTFTQAADHVLVVTTPEPTAITDAYAVIKVIARRDYLGRAVPASNGMRDLGSDERKVSLLVNQARSPAEGRVVYERIARVAQQFLNTTLYDAGSVPVDQRVPACVRRRTPFTITHPRCAASVSISQLAMKLVAGVAPVGPNGFFQRVGAWLKR